jgi:MarR family
VDFIGLTRLQLEARREELRPAVAEFKRIERELQALDQLEVESGSDRRQGGSRQTIRKNLPPRVRDAQVLDLLADHPEEYRRTELAQALGITKARAGQIVHGLIADQLVEERGAGRLAITEKAEEMRRYVVIRQGPWEAVDDL